MDRDSYAAALQRERAGYLAAGKNDRAAQVDAELKHLGVAPIEEAAASDAPEQATARKTTRKRTTKKAGD